jgi:ATP-dependent Clp protease adaptor protein ClpS
MLYQRKTTFKIAAPMLHLSGFRFRATVLKFGGQRRIARVPMSQQTNVKPRTRTKTKVERPKLWKVILLNDDYTPREFVVMVLKAVFRMGEETAYAVMLTAHRRGACVIAVFTKDVAETKAKEATDLAKDKGYPLAFSTEPEE